MPSCVPDSDGMSGLMSSPPIKNQSTARGVLSEFETDLPIKAHCKIVARADGYAFSLSRELLSLPTAEAGGISEKI